MHKNDLNKRKTLLKSIRNLNNVTKVNKKVKVICKSCKKEVEIENNIYHICPHCYKYLPMSGKDRFNLLLDKGYKIIEFGSEHLNPINFPNYKTTKIKGLKEAVTIAMGSIEGSNVIIAALESQYMMGTLGTFVGEELTKAVEYANKKRLPLIIVSVSGGARMQEGIFSLMQMAKVSVALSSFSENGGLYISLMTNPTMGGVSASFAAAGDINIAEPGAKIGFAGPRVIKETLHETLPEEFQSAEKLESLGFLDMILERKNQREVLGKILRLHRGDYGRI